ncbi:MULTISPECIES: SMI1/KNR4 family protein [unclassified Streptomyces]|uniref:SMI1/KNR4 family protein n=1 Tax=Streptomycetaceae TaxID=2062 RepID=UPI00037573BC|nr:MULTISPECIES: SMI1/KNR4 family protein [unclassified Streptomyces]
MARFEDLRSSLWDPGNRHGVRPPLTGRLIAEAERALRVTLPGSLLDLLRHQNGGVVAAEWDAFPTSRPTSWSADHVPFETVMGIGRREEALSMLDSPYLVGEWGLPTPVALISGGGPCSIALDYRVRGPREEPSVTWFDAELGEELLLAPDFRTFVEGLASSADFA